MQAGRRSWWCLLSFCHFVVWDCKRSCLGTFSSRGGWSLARMFGVFVSTTHQTSLRSVLKRKRDQKTEGHSGYNIVCVFKRDWSWHWRLSWWRVFSGVSQLTDVAVLPTQPEEQTFWRLSSVVFLLLFFPIILDFEGFSRHFSTECLQVLTSFPQCLLFRLTSSK